MCDLHYFDAGSARGLARSAATLPRASRPSSAALRLRHGSYCPSPHTHPPPPRSTALVGQPAILRASAPAAASSVVAKVLDAGASLPFTQDGAGWTKASDGVGAAGVWDPLGFTTKADEQRLKW